MCRKLGTVEDVPALFEQLADPADVSRAVASHDRVSWASHLGRGSGYGAMVAGRTRSRPRSNPGTGKGMRAWCVAVMSSTRQ